MPKDFFKLFSSLFICISVVLLGSIFTQPSIETWYVDLIKPAFNPPNWIFGPIWTILYIMMAIAVFYIWKEIHKHKKAKIAFWIFWGHLLLNFLWSVLFFGLHNILFAFIDIVLLFVVLIYLVYLFSKINKIAGNLLIPYAAWIAFAMILNFSILILN